MELVETMVLISFLFSVITLLTTWALLGKIRTIEKELITLDIQDKATIELISKFVPNLNNALNPTGEPQMVAPPPGERNPLVH